MTEEMFDLVVLGAGTGATGVAHACARAGWNVALVDPLPYGGTCALRGCDPKKMLVGVTEALDWCARLRGRGIAADSLAIDWKDLMEFKRSFTDPVPQRVEDGLQAKGVRTFHAEAGFTGPDAVDAAGHRLKARHFHIATGALPRSLGIPGEDLLTTSTGFLEMGTMPERITFIGGGFISFEFAHIAVRAGAREVSILHRGARPLVHFDPDLVNLQVNRTRELGIDVRLESCVDAVERTEDGLLITTTTPQGKATVNCDIVVHGAGRVPNIETLNLEAAGVETSTRGILVNEYMRSVSNPAVTAAGDCADTGTPNLTPLSANQARIAAKNLLAGKDSRPIRYPPIPMIVFTIPAVARVGLMESEATDHGMDFDVHFRETSRWYSSVRVAESHSAYKVLVERGSNRILGAHVMGPGAEEQINLFAMAMAAELSTHQVKALIFAYPSYASDLAFML